jgi:hypothetical protein
MFANFARDGKYTYNAARVAARQPRFAGPTRCRLWQATRSGLVKLNTRPRFFNEAAFSGFLLRENVIVLVFFGIVIKIGE